jgi:hypothetical protein
MATSNNSALYLEALKALKLQGEQAPYGSDARKLYSTKADSLRNILKTQFGMMNIDADYGAGVALKDTPGGGNVDWNVLSNAADILGTSQAGSTRSAFDRALGEYLTRNLPVWQKQGATTPSSAVTSTASTVMGGGGAAQSIISGQPVRTATNTSGIVAGQGTTPTAPAPINNMPSGANPNQPATDVVPTGQGNGYGSGTALYGDFIKSQYFANNDYEGYFISKTPNIPTVKDPSTGKVTIDWANPNMPANMYTLYGQGVGFWNTAQGLSKEQSTFNATAIEKSPAFIEQGKVFTAEMELLLKQNGLAVDAQIAGLKGSVDANKAGLEYELNTIKREVAASNWRSRQSLAASGMAFSGMLGYLYGQNEGKAMDNTIRATAVSAAEIKAMGEQMAILEGSKLSYASDLEGLYGAKRAAYRASLLDPQNARYTEVGQLLDDAIAGMEGTTAMATPSLAMGQRADVAAAQTANYEMVKEVAKLGKQGIWLSQDPNGNWTWTTGLTDAEQTARDSALFDQWYKTEGLKLDWATLDLDKDKLALDKAKQAFAEWATKQGLNLDAAKLDLEWAKLVETVATRKAGGTGGGSDTTTPSVYNPDGDLKILSNSGTTIQQKNRAALNITAGTGALSDDNFIPFMEGGTYAVDAEGNMTLLAAGQKAPKGSTTLTLPGLSGLDAAGALEVVHLIEDPVRQMVAAVILATKGKYGDQNTKWWDAMQALMQGNSVAKAGADGYDFSSDEALQIENALLAYFGNQPGPGGTKNVWQPPIYKDGKLVQEGYFATNP